MAIGRHVPDMARNAAHIAFQLSPSRGGLAQLLMPARARVQTGAEAHYLCGADAEPAARILAGFALRP